MQMRLPPDTSRRLRSARRGGSAHITLSLGLSSLWPPSLIQAPSQCRAQSQRHGFSVGREWWAGSSGDPRSQPVSWGSVAQSRSSFATSHRVGAPAPYWCGQALPSPFSSVMHVQFTLAISKEAAAPSLSLQVLPLCWGKPGSHMDISPALKPCKSCQPCLQVLSPGHAPSPGLIFPLSACLPSDGPQSMYGP